MSLPLNLADVARWRLVSQGLVEPWPTAADAVRAFACTQGQDFPGSTTSIALRTTDRTLAGVRDAYDAGEIVRSWPMRGTIFVVPPEDLGWMLSLTAAKVHRSTTRRREELGLSDAQLDASAEIASQALSGTGLTRADLLATITDAGHDVSEGRGYHTLFHLAVGGLMVQGPTVGKEQRWVLSSEWIRNHRRLAGTEAMIEWLRRYLTSHGPVPVAEFCWWTKLTKTEVKPAVEAVRHEFTRTTIDGVEYWFAPDLPDRVARLADALDEPLLLPGFDEIVLGYGDRSATLTKAEEALVVPGGNGMFKPTVCHRGRSVGVWKRPTRKNQPVTVTPFGAELHPTITDTLPALTAALPS